MPHEGEEPRDPRADEAATSNFRRTAREGVRLELHNAGTPAARGERAPPRNALSSVWPTWTRSPKIRGKLDSERDSSARTLFAEAGGDVTERREQLDRAEWWVTGIILLTSLTIIWTAFRPPMYDASSHLATGVIAQRILAGDEFTRAHYILLPQPVPYWLTTLGLLATQWLSPHAALKLLLSIYAVSLPVSFYLLARAHAPAALRYTPLIALTIFNWTYWRGETNFLFGQPLVPLATWLFLRLRRVSSPSFAAFAAVAVLSYWAHIFVLTAVIGVTGLLTAFELWRARRIPSRRPSRAQNAALILLAALLALAVYFIFAHHRTTANRGSLLFDFNPVRWGNLFEEPLTSPTIPSPVPSFALALSIAALWISSFPRHGSFFERLRARVDARFLGVGIAFAALYLFGPVGLVEEGGRREEDISPRYVLVAFLFLLLGTKLEIGRRGRQLFLLLILVMAGFKLADTRALHRRVGRTYETIVADVLSKIPEGSRLLPLNDYRPPGARRDVYFYLYAGNYVVVDRHGYSPTVFARAGQQPLRHAFGGEHRSIFDHTITPDEWNFYDYVLVQTNREQPAFEGLAENALEIAAAGGFRLYRIARPLSGEDAEAGGNPGPEG